jgi:hypothetical protein
MVVIVEMLFLGFCNCLWPEKEEERNTMSITNVSRRENVNGKNYELLMEIKGR